MFGVTVSNRLNGKHQAPNKIGAILIDMDKLIYFIYYFFMSLAIMSIVILALYVIFFSISAILFIIKIIIFIFYYLTQ
jgi:hypothetical protein